jgi:hypothetical protein
MNEQTHIKIRNVPINTSGNAEAALAALCFVSKSLNMSLAAATTVNDKLPMSKLSAVWRALDSFNLSRSDTASYLIITTHIHIYSYICIYIHMCLYLCM